MGLYINEEKYTHYIFALLIYINDVIYHHTCRNNSVYYNYYF